MNNNKISLVVVVLAIAAAATTAIVFTPVQDANARCNGGSTCQHNSQSSHVNAAVIDRSDVGNQAGSNSVTVTSGCGNTCGRNG
jgi:hypothetical protein